MKKQLSVIIGRFQIDRLHLGHYRLIGSARAKADKLVIIIGKSAVYLTDRNPLSYELRRTMIKRKYPQADVYGLDDHASDVIWSKKVDHILYEYERLGYEIKLYGSRDSFIPVYTGRHECVYVENYNQLSATAIRKEIAKTPEVDPAFSRGIIYAVENRFATAYPTVDIAILREQVSKEDYYPGVYGEGNIKDRLQLLLGRKKDSEYWQFIGGFVDPIDTNMLAAASRELHEEVTGLQNHELQYIGSAKIDDFRYKGTKDGIITTLFLTYIMGGNPQPADDIEAIEWFPLKPELKPLILPQHHILFDMLLKHLNK